MNKRLDSSQIFLKTLLKQSVSTLAISTIVFLPIPTKTAFAQNNNNDTKGYITDLPIDFIADELVHDKVHQLISAKGNVELSADKNTLKADNITFYQQDNIVKASGNIVLLEKNGNVAFADYLELTGDLKTGFIENINIILNDNSRLAARKVSRNENKKNVLEYGVFSPCDLCEENPNKPPIWQIKAIRVIHDEEKQDIVYKNAFLELGGIPVFYTPYFSHTSPEVKRRSGFLTPKMGGKSYLGATLETPYFYDLSPQEDFTISPLFTTKENIILKGEHRKIYDTAESEISGSITNNSEGEIKSQINIDSRKEINDYYVAETKIERISDDEYLKRYGLDGEDSPWLESNLRINGFDNRSYLSSKVFSYQDLRENINNNSTPLVLEPLNFNLINEPEEYGSYTSLTGSSMFLDRKKGAKSRRASLIAGWHLPYTSPYGDIYHMTASLRGDGYHVENVNTRSRRNYDGFVARVFPELSMNWRYPMARREEASYQVIEPVIVGVVSPTDINNDKIPNEDSQDLELDDTNILDTNRFIGYDRVETGSRINYGIRWSAYGEQTGQASVFLGQSYRFFKENYFPIESGLNENLTDYVGRIQAVPSEYLDLMYSFRLEQESLKARRNEVAVNAGTRVFKISSDYVFINSENSEFSHLEDRKEMGIKARSELTKFWNAEVYQRHDLTKDGGALNYGASLIYDDECFTVDTNFKRDYTSYYNHDSGYSFGLTLYFKTLGKVKTSN